MLDADRGQSEKGAGEEKKNRLMRKRMDGVSDERAGRGEIR